MGNQSQLHRRRPASRRFFAILSLGIAWLAPAITCLGAEPVVDFNRDIRPILSDNCFACHGPDQEKRKAKLRLDTEEGAKALRDGAAAIVPGKPADSQLIARILHNNIDDRMPPVKSNKKLTAHQIKLLGQWIEQGAAWKRHWSFEPPVAIQPPAMIADWPARNAIDRFLQARLKSEGLRPAGAADPRTLARRLSFDLLGLPPTAELVDGFVANPTPEAYDKLVEQLLASPRFGERMATHWLDLVRYADSNGYHGDQVRKTWLYRDYVIKSFNNNLPFDQFTIEQIAGDLLPNATREQRIASGYNRQNRTSSEGGGQPPEYLAKYAADRVRTTGSVWMGSTIGCAECHDHKFDPFTAKDFYSMAAFFADIEEPSIGEPAPTALPTPEQAAEIAAMDARLAELKKSLDTHTPALADARKAWEADLRANMGKLVWKTEKPTSITSAAGTPFTEQSDGSYLVTGEPNPDKDTYTLVLPLDGTPITGIRLEVIADPSLAGGRFSRSNGNIVLTEFQAELKLADKPAKPLKFAAAVADFSQQNFPASNAIDGKPATGWAIEGHVKGAPRRTALFTFAKPLTAPAGATLTLHLRHDSIYAKHNIGRFRISSTGAAKPALTPNGLPPAQFDALMVEEAKRTPEQRNGLDAYYRSIAPSLEPARKEMAQIQAKKKAFEAKFPLTLITKAIPPRQMRILPRGNWMDQSGAPVQPGVPEFLGKLSVSGRATRLDLAKWLVSPENPLAARVVVNRLWQLYFGTGISRITEDLGAQGELPIHPELLDYLALEFVRSGWDVKQMIRLMVTSHAYRQSSNVNSDLNERDPYNRLIARQSRFRLAAEFVRDNALSISGLLVDDVGGRSVFPYQPAGYWAQLNFPVRDYFPDKDENQYRRGVYTHWQRTFLHPSLVAFDAPSREECTATRTPSNTPLQALVLLNDPTYIEAARVFAERIIKDGGPTPQSRIAHAYRLALNRKPTDAETSTLAGLFTEQLKRYTADKPAAAKLLAVGNRPAAKEIDAAELAAWTSVTRILLNLHETISRY